MIKISAVIITFNEEQHIGRCLESLRDIVDEIMVVDSFSTDNTKAICEQYAARFIQHSFAGYIEQKNYAIQQATHDIVLSLDADEVLSDNLREAILKVKEKWAAEWERSFSPPATSCGRSAKVFPMAWPQRLLKPGGLESMRSLSPPKRCSEPER